MTGVPQEQRRVAVVTGGASGIGEATCGHLARAGHRVAVLDLDEVGVQRVADALRADGHDALGLAVDVTDRAGLEDAFAKVRADLGPTEILVTSAGLVAFDDFASITVERWNEVIDINLTGTFHACQLALIDMVAAQWGRIVTISSSSAQRGSPLNAHYAAAKGGVIVLTKSLARAYAAQGITANSIPPSAIETPMQHNSQDIGDLPSNDVIAATVPMGHLGSPDDIAAAATFLASDGAGFITGQVLGVNGGSVL
jgi:2-hydroxycyclohexanecarboxyl-CoA dehydrogenase